MKQCFSPNDVSRVLDDLLGAIDSRLFYSAPPRPAALADEPGQKATHATTSSGQSLTGAAFQVPPVHIPNAGEGAFARHSYKSELVLVRDPNVGTKKLLWWYDKDPRSAPHNHPWDFRSAILSGGYVEERFWIEDGKLRHEVCEWGAGDVNVVPANVYHNVVSVQKSTITFLDCGPARAGNEWGYLNTETLEHRTFKDLTPKNFLEMFQTINPHLIKKGEPSAAAGRRGR
jgi:quercetin dioxygenase-like cupin family protein